MKKNVQIPYELFIDLVYVYLLDCDDADIRKRIERGLNAKVESMVAHELYEKYKTAPTEEEREKARLEYLDRRGIHKDFRW